MSTAAAGFNAQVIREFRARGGHVGRRVRGNASPSASPHRRRVGRKTDRVIPVIALTKTTETQP